MKSNILQDILIVGGIGLIASGLWIFAPWVSLTTTGIMLFGLGVVGFFFQK